MRPQTASGSGGDPMVQVINPITKSVTFPSLTFAGQPDSNTIESLTWYPNGTTAISDNRGNSFTYQIPILSGVTFTLLQNSTTIDQKLIGSSLQYDIYWNAIQNKNGVVQKYKFSIIGSSINGTTIQFPVKSSENIVSDKNELWATKASAADFSSQNQANFTETGGIGINWADAIHQGYQVNFDSSNSALDFSVGTSFLIDPTVVTTGVPAISPISVDYYEGERRVVDIGGNLFAFYFDGSNLVYRNSTNGGSTWSSSHLVGNGTGALASDSQRWTIGSTTVSGNQYISVVYWSKFGIDTLISYIRGSVSPNSLISWGTPSTLLTLTNNLLSCQTGVCAAANEANDTSGNLFLTVRWVDPITGYTHQEFKSTNGGNSFSSSHNATAISTCCRPELVLTKLANGNMLLTQTTYEGSQFTYSIYSSSNSSWHSPITTSGSSGLFSNTVKEISADSNTTQSAYIAYVTGSPSGTLKVAKWANNGVFNGFETANSTLSHALPSITITRDNTIHVYTLSGGKVWKTDKSGSSWAASTNPFGASFNSPDQLTSPILYASALWEESSSTPYNLVFGTAASTSADFSMSSFPSSLTVQQGNAGSSTITVNSLNGFNSAVTLSASGTPSGVTASFSPNPITPASGGSATSTLTITVSSTAAIGTYTLSVTGTSGSLVHSTPITLTITALSISSTANTGILEPLYLSPYNGTFEGTTSCTSASCFAWNPVNYTKTNFPNVPFFAIINPDNGIPTSDGGCSATYIPSYQKGTANLTKSGTIILGYVFTSSGTRPISDVRTEINYYHTCLPNVKGIFMDEMSNNANTGNLTYYGNLTKYIHNNESMLYSIGNPGTETNPQFQSSVDKMTTYEDFYNDTSNPLYLNSTLQGTADDGGSNQWHTQYGKDTFSLLQFNKTIPSKAEIQGDSVFTGFMYLTDNTGCGTNPVLLTSSCPPSKQNPWNTTSSYLTTLASYLNNPSVSLSTQSFNASSNNATITGFDQLIYQSHFLSNNLARSQTFTPFTYNATQGWPYTINALPFAIHTGNCMSPHYWVYNNVNYTNPITITAPTQTATLSIYYKATNSPC